MLFISCYRYLALYFLKSRWVESEANNTKSRCLLHITYIWDTCLLTIPQSHTCSSRAQIFLESPSSYQDWPCWTFLPWSSSSVISPVALYLGFLVSSNRNPTKEPMSYDFGTITTRDVNPRVFRVSDFHFFFLCILSQILRQTSQDRQELQAHGHIFSRANKMTSFHPNSSEKTLKERFWFAESGSYTLSQTNYYGWISGFLW